MVILRMNPLILLQALSFRARKWDSVCLSGYASSVSSQFVLILNPLFICFYGSDLEWRWYMLSFRSFKHILNDLLGILGTFKWLSEVLKLVVLELIIQVWYWFNFLSWSLYFLKIFLRFLKICSVSNSKSLVSVDMRTYKLNTWGDDISLCYWLDAVR